MKVLSFALFLAQADLLTFRAFACRGHHQHHHADSHHRDLLEADNDADFDFLPCGMGATSDEQRLEESKAMSSWKAKHANRNLGETDITIPVYFHVIRDDQGNGDVPDGMVYAYLQSLNDEFAGTAFSFRMISINRINNSEWHACTFSNNREAKTVHNVPGKQNMNVYFCDIQNGSGGWAYMPYNAGNAQYDGIVLESNYQKMGFPKGYVRRSVLPHEAGHWLGLYHTHQDGCDAKYSTNGSWNADFSYFNGDGVLDTAAHVVGEKDCSRAHNTCPDDVEGVDPGDDPLDNIMSYAYDRCTETFTPGQEERMVAMYEYYRHDPDAPEPELPTPPPKTYCDVDKCTGRIARFFGMTHRVRTVSGTCRSRCVRQATAERWMKEDTHECGSCPA